MSFEVLWLDLVIEYLLTSERKQFICTVRRYWWQKENIFFNNLILTFQKYLSCLRIDWKEFIDFDSRFYFKIRKQYGAFKFTWWITHTLLHRNFNRRNVSVRLYISISILLYYYIKLKSVWTLFYGITASIWINILFWVVYLSRKVTKHHTMINRSSGWMWNLRVAN